MVGSWGCSFSLSLSHIHVLGCHYTLCCSGLEYFGGFDATIMARFSGQEVLASVSVHPNYAHQLTELRYADVEAQSCESL